MRTPDPLDMLDVIEEARQRAMAQREAAVDHLAATALRAIVEGHDVREVARRCGFDLSAQPRVSIQDQTALDSNGLFALWAAPPARSPEQNFADWLASAVKRLVTEGLERKL